MFTTTLILNGKAAQSIRESDIQLAITVTVNIDPNTARREVTVWLVSEVGNKLMGGTPQLVIANQAVWRVPALLTSSKIGTVGQVGTVDVDVITGELFVNDELIEQILHNAKHLVHPTYPSIATYDDAKTLRHASTPLKQRRKDLKLFLCVFASLCLCVFAFLRVLKYA